MFVTRLLTVAVALPAFIAALFWLPQPVWALFLLAALCIAGWEWGGLAGYSTALRCTYAGLVAASALLLGLVLLPAGGAPSAIETGLYVLSVAFWVAVAPVWLRLRVRARNPWLVAAVGWLVLVPMWLALARLQASPWALLMFLSVVWIADTAAYVAGRSWGRRKLAPEISPGKTWEGVAGAALALSVCYLALWFIVPASARYFGFFGGALLFAALLALSIEGDLFESWMKRQAGKKDSGSLLPGHGGVLDRVDGLTATMPAAALAFHFY